MLSDDSIDWVKYKDDIDLLSVIFHSDNSAINEMSAMQNRVFRKEMFSKGELEYVAGLQSQLEKIRTNNNYTHSTDINFPHARTQIEQFESSKKENCLLD